MKHRSGISLIELMVAVTLVSILLSATAVLLTALFRSEVQLRGDLRQQTALARLNHQFRADAHAAAACAVTDRCVLTRRDGLSIEYAWQAPRLTRRVLREETVELQDAFELSGEARLRFSREDVGSRQLVQMTIEPGETPPRRYATAVRRTSIEAVVDLHRNVQRSLVTNQEPPE